MIDLFAYLLGTGFPLVMVITFLIGINQSNINDLLKRKYSIGLIVLTVLWVLTVWILAVAGLFEYQSGDPIPRFLAGLLFPVLIGIWLFRKVVFQEILNATPHYLIVGMQTLRILGISFLFLAHRGEGPIEFASAGYGDLITGMLALIAGILLYAEKRNAAWSVILFNAAGLFDLLNVSRILLLYYPSWYSGHPSTQVAGQYPTVLILCIAAPIALMFHFYSIREMIKTWGRKEHEVHKIQG